MTSSHRFTSPRGRKLTGLAKKHPLSAFPATPAIKGAEEPSTFPIANAGGHILLADGDLDAVAVDAFALAAAGYRVSTAATAREVLQMLDRERIDLVLIGATLGTTPGLALLRQIRTRDRRLARGMPDGFTAVAMMFAGAGAASDDERHRALEAGADDVLLRPFPARELRLRCVALLRRVARSPTPSPDVFRMGALHIDFGGHQVTLDQATIDLSPSEFAILRRLAERVGQLCTRAELHGARQSTTTNAGRSIDMQISRIRRKLGVAGDLIENVRGMGYRLRRVRPTLVP